MANWNQLEPVGTSWRQLKSMGADWSRLESTGFDGRTSALRPNRHPRDVASRPEDGCHGGLRGGAINRAAADSADGAPWSLTPGDRRLMSRINRPSRSRVISFSCHHHPPPIWINSICLFQHLDSVNPSTELEIEEDRRKSEEIGENRRRYWNMEEEDVIEIGRWC